MTDSKLIKGRTSICDTTQHTIVCLHQIGGDC